MTASRLPCDHDFRWIKTIIPGVLNYPMQGTATVFYCSGSPCIFSQTVFHIDTIHSSRKIRHELQQVVVFASLHPSSAMKKNDDWSGTGTWTSSDDIEFEFESISYLVDNVWIKLRAESDACRPLYGGVRILA